jgi:hypothetical protein
VAKADTLPVLKGLNFDEKDAFLIEKNHKNDTIHYWVKDSLIYKKDTLSMSLSYLYTDTLNQLVPRTDTLNLIVKKAKGAPDDRPTREEKEKRKENEPEPTRFIAVKPTIPASMNVYDSISFVFDEPLDHYIGGCHSPEQKCRFSLERGAFCLCADYC